MSSGMTPVQRNKVFDGIWTQVHLIQGEFITNHFTQDR